jgi:hypothetical protein
LNILSRTPTAAIEFVSAKRVHSTPVSTPVGRFASPVVTPRPA